MAFKNISERFLSTHAADLSRLSFQPSTPQINIFSWMAYGQGNLVVRARAGTGKTTTIVSALSFLPPSSVLLAAFSKDIADELSARTNTLQTRADITAKSLHAVGNGLCWRYLGQSQRNGTEVDAFRGRRLAEQAIGAGAPREVITLVKDLASLGKNCNPFANPGDMMPLMHQFDLWPTADMLEKNWTAEKICASAHKAMQLATQPEKNSKGAFVIDFDDMIYLPVRMKWMSRRYDLVIIDEAQDMNRAQLMLAEGVAKNRIMVVGDDRQAIYGFRGADSNSIDRLKTSLRATELPLNITYRCGRKIVKLAQELVPDYACPPDAHEGEIVDASNWDTIFETAKGGDFVLSRNNAQITTICLHLLRNNTPAFIRGRDIGEKIKNVVKQLKVTTIAQLLKALPEWADIQLSTIAASLPKGGELTDQQIDSVHDQRDTIKVLAEECDTIEELLRKIDGLFSNSQGGTSSVCCSTVHRAKGLEANKVFLLVDTLRYDGLEERNIAYVGITRAKKVLVRVRGK